jgi:hypothetical protein
VAWFKKYRDILESDLIHVRRPDGRDLDCFLHVNPALKHQALAVVYNPLDQVVERTLTLPLYYSGLEHEVMVGEQEGPFKKAELDRSYRLSLPAKLAPDGITWFVFEAAN